MTTAEEKYKDIINRRWDDNPAFFARHPRMPLKERAKIFAPFATLRGHGNLLSQEEDAQLHEDPIEHIEGDPSAIDW